MKTLAPVILFVYNRPGHTADTLNSLLRNPECAQTDLFIFSDAARNEEGQVKVAEVRRVIRNIQGFRSLHITERKENMGLARSVITGVSEVIEKYGRAIVMEDDLESGPDFLHFMNEMLDHYQDHPEVYSVSGYGYPIPFLNQYPYSVYFSHRGSSWSWGTWKDRWNKINWNLHQEDRFISNRAMQKQFNMAGEDLSIMLIKQDLEAVDSWAIRFAYNIFRLNGVHALAARPKIQNIGQDNSGTHSVKTDKYQVALQAEEAFTYPPDTHVYPEVMEQNRRFFRKSFLQRAYRSLRRALGYPC